jgi:hypothetical protein
MMPDPDVEPLILTPAEEWRRFATAYRSCSGTPDCDATTHLHGCFADTGDCNLPEEHASDE